MTEYLFPPDRPSEALGNAAPMVLLALLLVSLTILVWRSFRPPAWIDLAGWLVIATGSTIIYWHIANTQFDDQSIGWAMLLTYFLALLGMVQLGFRKQFGHSAWNALGRSAGVVIVLFIIAGCCLPYGLGGGHRDGYRWTQCRNNLKQLGLAVHNFFDQSQYLPPPQFQDGTAPPRSWRVELLPYLEQEDLRRRYADAQPWDSPANAELLPLCPREYRCPSMPEERTVASRQIASYAMPTGPQAFGNERRQTFDDIRDGLSNTIMFVEACGRNLIWLQPRDVDVVEQDLGINQPGSQPGYSRSVLSSYHREAANVVLGDGSVRRISEQTDPQLLRALLTVDGSEQIDPEWHQAQ